MKSTRGFTLLETLIAMMILTGAIIIVANAWSGNFMRLRKTAVNQEITHLIERKMLDIELEYKDDLSQVPEELDGDFGSNYPRYRWELKSREFEMPDVSSAITQEKGGTIDQNFLTIIQQTQEYLKKAVKEVKLTVFVKSNNNKEIPFSITTYFVNYDQEFNLPLGGLGGLGGGNDGGSPTSGSGNNNNAGGGGTTQ